MMNYALTIGRLFGIQIKLHWSFLFISLVVIYWRIGLDNDWSTIGRWCAFLFATIFCVFLHELGHALSAKYYGITTEHITLLPIGGMAVLNGLPKKATHEMVVAFAGPFANLLIAIVLALYLWLTTEQGIALIGVEEGLFDYDLNFLQIIFRINFCLFAFNLFPAYPFDGWRIFRAALSTMMSRLKATRLSIYVSFGLGLTLLIYGLVMDDKRFMILGIFTLFMIRRAIPLTYERSEV